MKFKHLPNINNGVKHAEFGEGLVIATCNDDKVLVRFTNKRVEKVPYTELESLPKAGITRTFPRR